MQESLLETVIESEAKEINQEYKVLARKYRPNFFRELIGQEVVVETFKNAITNDRLHHAFVLTGTRGIGKTTTARIIAKALNCENLKDGYEPCGKCDACIAIAASRHQDVLEIDAASHTSVDNIREIIDGSMFKPVSAKYKVYIIDEVHMLSKSAFNALLKTLEEPPSHVKFIFATTEVRKIPITILSRCQKFDLRRISVEELSKHFANVCKQESVKSEEKALNAIAIAAKGSVRDGLSILDQAISLSESNVTFEVTQGMLGNADATLIVQLLQNIIEGKLEASLKMAERLKDHGADAIMVLEDLAHLLYNLTRAQVVGDTQNVIEEVEVNFCQEFAPKVDLIFLTRAWQIMQKGISDLAQSVFPEEELEMVLIKLNIVNTSESVEELLKQPPANADTSKATVANPKTDDKKKINPTQVFEWDAVAKLLHERHELMLYHYVYNKLAEKSFEDGALLLARQDVRDLQLEKALQKFICENFADVKSVEFINGSGDLSLNQIHANRDQSKIDELSNHPLVAKILAENDGTKVKKVVLH